MVNDARRRLSTVFVIACAALPAGCGGDRAELAVGGSLTIAPVAADAAEALRDDIDVTLGTIGGSAGGMSLLATGEIDVAMNSRPISAQERAAFPAARLRAVQIGADAVGIVVRREVFDGGVRSLDRDQLQRLFEGRVTNWRELGGPDIAVAIVDLNRGRGTRAALDTFLYGEDGDAPAPPRSAPITITRDNEEARAKLTATPGAVGPLSHSLARTRRQLALIAVDGVLPTVRTIADGSYPLARPLLLVTDGPPTTTERRFVDFLRSARGQRLVANHHFVTLRELGRA